MSQDADKTENSKSRKKELLIALLFLLLSLYGLKRVMEPNVWIDPSDEPKIAKLEDSILPSPANEMSDEIGPATLVQTVKTFVRRIFHPSRHPAGLPIVVDSASSSRRFGTLSLIPRFLYSRIDSTDILHGGTASFLSNLNYGIDLIWGQHWTDAFETNLHLGFLTESYVTDTSQKTFENSSHALGNFGFGASYTSGLTYNLGIGIEQHDFVRATNATDLIMDVVPIPKVSLGVSIPLLDMDPFTLSLQASYAYLFGSQGVSYSVNSGNGMEAGLSLGEMLSSNVVLSGRFWYGQANQSSSIASQSYKEMGMNVGATYRFQNQNGNSTK